MRAIKFRAFYKGDIEEWEHNGNARMIYDIQNAYDGTGFDDPEGGFGWVSCFSDFMDDEKMSLMQYTGLVDKNGTEIYVGDVCYDAHLDEKGKIVYAEGMFLYEQETVAHRLFEVIRDIEVIGNVYENPELLQE